MTPDGRRYFADFCLNLNTGELRQHDRPVPLERQPALVLVRLVADAGLLVTRRQLQAAVWPEQTHVDFDRGLNYCLRQLRVALGDDVRSPRFVETVPRQGYRFIAPVRSGRPRLGRTRRRTLIAAAAAAVLLTAVIESGPGANSHHAGAVKVVRTVHAWLFGR